MTILPQAKLPEAVPYAGQMSVNVYTNHLEGSTPDTVERLDLVLRAEGVASNVVPHMLRRLTLFGVDQADVSLTNTVPPIDELQSIAMDELVDAAASHRSGKQVWARFAELIVEREECGLILGEDATHITGDFGFGIEWLKLYHSPSRATSIIDKILLRRSSELGLV